jgi:hypothetical protein
MWQESGIPRPSDPGFAIGIIFGSQSHFVQSLAICCVLIVTNLKLAKPGSGSAYATDHTNVLPRPNKFGLIK